MDADVFILLRVDELWFRLNRFTLDLTVYPITFYTNIYVRKFTSFFTLRMRKSDKVSL